VQIDERLTDVCWLCGDALHLVADQATDEYTWVDERGGAYALDSDLRHLCGGNPYARLKQLADAVAVPRRGVTARSARDIKEYAALQVRVEAGTFHRHSPRNPPIYIGPRIRHCNSAGWLRPSGWRCRVCHVHLTNHQLDQSALSRLFAKQQARLAG
jgi:hypothetical protein